MNYQIVSVLALITLIMLSKKSNWFQYAKKNKYVQIVLLLLLSIVFFFSLLNFTFETNKIINTTALLLLLSFSSYNFYAKHIVRKK